VAALALMVAGCGGDDSETAATAGKPAGVETITIAVSNDTPVFAQPFIAQALGYFEQAGVNVKLLDNTGSNTLNFVAAGQADLGMIAAGTPLLMAEQGKDSQIIYSPQGGAAGGMLVGGKDAASVAAIKGKRIGTLPTSCRSSPSRRSSAPSRRDRWQPGRVPGTRTRRCSRRGTRTSSSTPARRRRGTRSSVRTTRRAPSSGSPTTCRGKHDAIVKVLYCRAWSKPFKAKVGFIGSKWPSFHFAYCGTARGQGRPGR
jgi:hypothetical protein